MTETPPLHVPRFTVFDTPVVGTLLRWAASGVLRLAGWSSRIVLPDAPQFVVAVAPHTSFWDFPILMATALVHRVRGHWLGKHTLFRGPFRPFFRWLGGIAVDPTRAGEGRVAAALEVLRQTERLIVGVAPEATLRRVERWRTGFYHIALGAGIPIVLVALDYPSRTVTAGGSFVPTGDTVADFARIRAFYAPVRGRHPDRFTLPGDGDPPEPRPG
jgi:1-acyl-sn-glycerol-3-phosphate acyltransferase